VERHVLDASRSGEGPVVGSCDHGNEPLGSIKGRQFSDQMSDYLDSQFHVVSYTHPCKVKVWFTVTPSTIVDNLQLFCSAYCEACDIFYKSVHNSYVRVKFIPQPY